MDAVTYNSIGTLHTPFTDPANMPIQPAGAAEVCGSAKIRPDLMEALTDLEGFSHVILLYHFHKVGPTRMTVRPFLDDRPHGVLAVRAPARPNSIGLSVVELLGRDGATLHLRGVDMLDGTPLLDIKPYVPAFDQPTGAIRIGWLADRVNNVGAARADDRFGGNTDD